MKLLSSAALSALLFIGAASASAQVPRVDAVADAADQRGLTMSCVAPQVRSADVDAILGSHEAVKTVSLRKGLIAAIQQACAQDIARIVVTRRGTAVAWAPAREADAAVAVALR